MPAGWLESIKSLFGGREASITYVVLTIRTPASEEEIRAVASRWASADFERLFGLPEVREHLKWNESEWRQARSLADFTVLGRFSLIGMLVDVNRLPELEKLPAVRRVFRVEPGFEYDYLNILKGLHWLIAPEGDQPPPEVNVTNMSLQPWDPYPFDELEPMNVATRVLTEHGITVVVAAGNFGDRGENTLSPWSVAPWVIGVGATEPDGKTLWARSSRGIPDDELYHPTVVAVGVDDHEHQGTSFATPRVSGLVACASEFIQELAKAPSTALWVAQAQQMGVKTYPIESRPNVLKRMIEDMAVRLEGYGRHETGAGFVDKETADRYFAGFRLSNFIQVFCYR